MPETHFKSARIKVSTEEKKVKILLYCHLEEGGTDEAKTIRLDLSSVNAERLSKKIADAAEQARPEYEHDEEDDRFGSIVLMQDD